MITFPFHQSNFGLSKLITSIESSQSPHLIVTSPSFSPFSSSFPSSLLRSKCSSTRFSSTQPLLNNGMMPLIHQNKYPSNLHSHDIHDHDEKFPSTSTSFPYQYLDPSSFPTDLNTSSYFKFHLLYQSKKSRARVGIISTPHGDIETPGFVPVATNGVLKYVDLATTAQTQLNTQLVFINTYHMMIHPGPDIVSNAGGLHQFTGYKKPIITDSGGFQIFSMANQMGQEELKGKSISKSRKNNGSLPCFDKNSSSIPTVSNLVKKLDEHGVLFRSYRDGRLIELTPRSSVEAQKKLGADIIIPLDILLPNSATIKKRIRMFHRTHRWEAESLMAHLEDLRQQAMYGVIHGGTDIQLRQLSVQYISKLPFQGLAIGGSLGKDVHEMHRLLESISNSMVEISKPIHLLGIGDEKSIKYAVQLGIDTFDSAYPTRAGRHGSWMSDGKIINMNNKEYNNQHGRPVESCQCPICSNYSRAYVHHLIKMKEPVSCTMGTTHNIYYMMKMMEKIRKDIMDGWI